MLMINPEILNTKATHTYNGVPVKVFLSTARGDVCTAQIMDGKDKGMCTDVYVSKCVPVETTVIHATNSQGFHMFNIGVSWYIGKFTDNGRKISHVGQRKYIEKLWKENYK